MHPPPMEERPCRIPPRRSAPDRRFHPIGAYAPEAGKAARGRVPAFLLALSALLLVGGGPMEDALRRQAAGVDGVVVAPQIRLK